VVAAIIAAHGLVAGVTGAVAAHTGRREAAALAAADAADGDVEAVAVLGGGKAGQASDGGDDSGEETHLCVVYKVGRVDNKIV